MSLKPSSVRKASPPTAIESKPPSDPIVDASDDLNFWVLLSGLEFWVQLGVQEFKQLRRVLGIAALQN